MHDPDVVILLFASGKLVCTGAVDEKMVYDAAEKLMGELIKFVIRISKLFGQAFSIALIISA
ncbi:MAG: hypothetical protein FGF48_09885 [Candidatus Brockarchaeota archaeon]|nr:hypothetical protein [Candidatus Brockarchaeota archaeon]MBO3842704.1 hypothetical protein [Candidatus Brockarchaeota archaeon]